MGNDNTLLIIAVIVLIASVIGFFIVLGLNKNIQLAPAVGEEGTAQVEIIQNIRIDTTVALINFGVGFVNPASGPLTLYSNHSGIAFTNWLDSTSTPIILLDEGFVVENTGNIDINMTANMETALDTWLPPGPGGSVTLDYSVKNCDTTTPNVLTDDDCTYATQISATADTDPSCSFPTVTTPLGVYTTIPVTPTVSFTCNRLEFEDTKDELRKNAVMCSSGVSPYYFGGAESKDPRGSNCDEELITDSLGRFVYKYDESYTALPIAIEKPGGATITIKKKNKGSVYVNSTHDLLINGVHVDSGNIVIHFTKFDRSSKWDEDIVSKYILEKYGHDSTDDLLSNFDEIIKKHTK